MSVVDSLSLSIFENFFLSLSLFENFVLSLPLYPTECDSLKRKSEMKEEKEKDK